MDSIPAHEYVEVSVRPKGDRAARAAIRKVVDALEYILGATQLMNWNAVAAPIDISIIYDALDQASAALGEAASLLNDTAEVTE